MQKALWIEVGAARAIWTFRTWPRVTLAILALLCALVAAAVLWNIGLLMLTVPGEKWSVLPTFARGGRFLRQ
jgi:hypothetical protein